MNQRMEVVLQRAQERVTKLKFENKYVAYKMNET